MAVSLNSSLRVRCRLSECSPDQLLTILAALAQLGVRPPDALNSSCLQLLIKYLPALGPRQVAGALTSLATLQRPLDTTSSSALLSHMLAGVYVWDADDMEAVASSFGKLNPSKLPELDLELLEDLILQVVTVHGGDKDKVLRSSSVRALSKLAFARRLMDRRPYVPRRPKAGMRMKKRAGLTLSRRRCSGVVLSRAL